MTPSRARCVAASAGLSPVSALLRDSPCSDGTRIHASPRCPGGVVAHGLSPSPFFVTEVAGRWVPSPEAGRCRWSAHSGSSVTAELNPGLRLHQDPSCVLARRGACAGSGRVPAGAVWWRGERRGDGVCAPLPTPLGSVPTSIYLWQSSGTAAALQPAGLASTLAAPTAEPTAAPCPPTVGPCSWKGTKTLRKHALEEIYLFRPRGGCCLSIIHLFCGDCGGVCWSLLVAVAPGWCQGGVQGSTMAPRRERWGERWWGPAGEGTVGLRGGRGGLEGGGARPGAPELPRGGKGEMHGAVPLKPPLGCSAKVKRPWQGLAEQRDVCAPGSAPAPRTEPGAALRGEATESRMPCAGGAGSISGPRSAPGEGQGHGQGGSGDRRLCQCSVAEGAGTSRGDELPGFRLR